MRRLLGAVLLAAGLAGLAAAPVRAQNCTIMKGVNQAGTTDYTTIGAAIAAIPVSLAGDYCISILDSLTYTEPLVIRGITTNDNRIYIGGNPASRPTVRAPAGSNAIFHVDNASVTIDNVNFHGQIGLIGYGIRSSSQSLHLSSVNVRGEAGGFTSAGIWLSTPGALVEFSSVTMNTSVYGLMISSFGHRAVIRGSTFAYFGGPASVSPLYLLDVESATITGSVVTANSNVSGLWISGGRDHVVTLSSATSFSLTGSGLKLTGTTGNLISGAYLGNTAGAGLAMTGSSSNTVTLSTIASNSSSFAFSISAGSYNVIAQSYVQNMAGDGGGISSGDSNRVERSTIAAGGAGDYALIVNSSSRTTVSSSTLLGLNGRGVFIGNAVWARIEYSSVTGFSANSAVNLSNASSATIAASYIQALAGLGIELQGGSRYNTVVLSSVVAGGVDRAVRLVDGHWNTFDRAYVANANNAGIYIEGGSSWNVIAFSTVTTSWAVSGSIYVVGASSNIIHGSVVSNTAAHAVTFDTGALYNRAQSSRLSGASGVFSGLTMSNASRNSVLDSYLTGGRGISLFSNADFNTVAGCTVIASDSGGFSSALHLFASFSNQISSSYFQNINAHGVFMESGSGSNVISGSTMVTLSAAHSALHLDNADSNTVAASLMSNDNGYAGNFFNTSDSNIIDRSTMTGSTAMGTLFITNSDGNAIIRSYLSNNAGGDAALLSGADLTTVSLSTFFAQSSPGNALYISNSDSSTVTGSVLTTLGGRALYVAAGSESNVIAQSRLASYGIEDTAVLFGVSSNTVTDSYLQSQNGSALLMDGGATNNTVDLSTLTRLSFGSGDMGLWITQSSSNTVRRSYMQSNGDHGLRIDGINAGFNIVDLSTGVSRGFGTAGLSISLSTSNNVMDSWFYADNGVAMDFDTASDNTVSRSTVVTTSGDPAGRLLFSDRNLIEDSYFANMSGVQYGFQIMDGAQDNGVFRSHLYGGLMFDGGNDHNTVSDSVMTSPSSFLYALNMQAGSSNTVLRGYIDNPGGTAARLWRFTSTSTVLMSTITSANAGMPALLIESASTNTISLSYIQNLPGRAIHITEGAEMTTISHSTAVSSSREALFIERSSATTVRNGYLVGSTGTLVVGSTGTVVYGARIEGTGVGAAAFSLSTGNVSLMLATSTLIGPPTGRGLVFGAGNGGYVSVGSVTISGAQVAMLADPNQANFEGHFDSVTIRSLAPGGVGLSFLSGAINVASFTAFYFEDASVAVNVDGSNLTAGSSVRMVAHGGARTGPAFENDPGGVVHWSNDVPYPGCAVTRNVGIANPYGTIQSAVNALPPVLTGPACVLIRDATTYFEQVVISGFINIGSSITIMADPALTQRPVIDPPAASIAGFRVFNDSVAIVGVQVHVDESIDNGIEIAASYALVDNVVVSTGGALSIWDAGISVNAPYARISHSTISVEDGNAVYLFDADRALIEYSLLRSSDMAWGTLHMSSVYGATVTGSFITNDMGDTLNVFSSSGNVISASTMTTKQFGWALYMNGSASNKVDGVYAWNQTDMTALIENASADNVFDNSVFVGSSTWPAFMISLSMGNLLTRSSLYNHIGTAYRASGSGFSSVDSSTVVARSTYSYGLHINSDDFRLTGSYVQAASTAVYADFDRFYISGSTLVANRGQGSALHLNFAWDSYVLDSMLLNPSGQALLAESFANNNIVARSTIVASAFSQSTAAVRLLGVSSHTFLDNYIQGAQAFLAIGSTGTWIGGSTLISTSMAAGVVNAQAGVNFMLTSSTVRSYGAGFGVNVSGNAGSVFVTTNTIDAPFFGVRAGPHPSNVRIHLASNTIVAQSMANANTAGVLLDGLPSGATVQNNTIVYRRPGTATGPANFTRGVHVVNSAGVLLERNRISHPGVIAAGVNNHELVFLDNADNVWLNYNDLHSMGTVFASAHLFKAVNASMGTVLTGNIFSSAFSASASSTTLSFDGTSQVNVLSDYNDFHSSNTAPAFSWGGGPLLGGLSGWQSGTGRDTNSISANPLWNDPTAGVEDFHPKSSRGRYDPAIAGFTMDNVLAYSPTIDRGAPTDPFSQELSPNGVRANQGSYADTAEASLTGQPYPGCVQTYNVGAGQEYATITLALSVVPPTLAGHTCVVLEDAAVYSEQVDVSGFKNNGSSLTIRYRYDDGPRPVVSPPALSTAGFLVQNASVTIIGIDVRADNDVSYGVYASSGWLTLSSMTVGYTSPLGITEAGIRLSSWSGVHYVTVTVSDANALYFDGTQARFNVVAYSSFTASNNGGAIELATASTNTFVNVWSRNNAGHSLWFNTASDDNRILNSTFSAAVFSAVRVSASRNTIEGSVIKSVGGNALSVANSGIGNRVVFSSLTSVGLTAVMLQSASSTTIEDSWISGVSGVFFADDAISNAVLRSTITTNSAFEPAVDFYSATASSNVLSASYVINPGGAGVRLRDGASYNRVETSALYAEGVGLHVENSTANAISGNFVFSASSYAVHLAAAHYNRVESSTMTRGGGAAPAFRVAASSRNIVAGLYVFNPAGDGAHFWQGSYGNSVSSSVFISSNIASIALYSSGSSSNTYDAVSAYNPFFRAAYFYDCDLLTVTRSTFTSEGNVALHMSDTSSATVSAVSARSYATPAFILVGGGHNQILQLVAESGNGAAAAFYVNGSSWNVIDGVRAHNASSRALHLQSLVNHNTFANSYFSSDNGTAIELESASSNTFTNVFSTAALGNAAYFGSASNHNKVLFSTFAAYGFTGFQVASSTNNLVEDSYVEGSSAAVVGANSYGTTFHRSHLAGRVGINNIGCALQVSNAGQVTVTSGVVTSFGDGVCLDTGNYGQLLVGSNTISARGNGVRVLNQGLDARVFIASNTIVPQLGNWESRGLRFEGLTTGATAHNNSIYFRVAGGGGGLIQRGIHVLNSSSVLLTRNRVNVPDTVTAGELVALHFDQSAVTLLNNDVHVVAQTALQKVALLETSGAGGIYYLRNNIFSSSATAIPTSSTYTVRYDGGTLDSDYNVYHSSNGVPTFYQAAIYYHGLAAWNAFGFRDRNSRQGHPYWVSTTPGAEDFHVMSTAGRCADAPACSSHVNDALDSASLDAGNPADDYAAEPAPNGYQANAGTTGGTIEASKTPAGPCAVTRTVCKTGGCSFSSIQTAVDSIPDPLVGHSCVLIRDTATYFETVSIASFTLAGSSITVMADPAFSTGAVLMPPVGNFSGAILDIQVASTTVSGLTLRAFMNYAYGVRVTSPNVTLSSVSVFDTANNITVAGIVLSSETSLSYSTVSIAGNNTVGLMVSSASWVRVSYSSFSWAGLGASNPLLYFAGASTVALSDVQVWSSGSKDAAWIVEGSSFTVERATFSTFSGGYALRIGTLTASSFTGLVLAANSGRALDIGEGSSGLTVDRADALASAGPAQVGVLVRGSSHVVTEMRLNVTGSGTGLETTSYGVRFSSVHVNFVGGQAVSIRGSTGTVFEYGSAYGVGVHAFQLIGGGGGHTVTDSSMTVAGAGAPAALRLENVSTNTFARMTLTNLASNGYGLYAYLTSSNTVTASTITSAMGTPAVYLGMTSTMTLSDTVVTAYNGTGVYLDFGADRNTIERSTIVAMGNVGASYGIAINQASRNSIVDSVIISTGYYGLVIQSISSLNTVLRSSIAGLGGSVAGLYINNSDSNTVTSSYLSGPSGYGAYIASASEGNIVALSTVVNGSFNHPAFLINAASLNLIDGSVVISTGGFGAIQITNIGAGSNLVDRTVARVTAAGGRAVDFTSPAGGNVFSRSHASAVNDAVMMTGFQDRVQFSTAVGGSGYAGVRMGGMEQSVHGSYVEGSTGVHINGATSSRVGSNRIAGVGSLGAGLYVLGATDLNVSSNVISGPTQGAGVRFDNGFGMLVVSTNTFLPGAMYGLRTADLGVGAQLWITSNTILPTVGGSTSTYGLYFDGLSRGATVQNNGIYYRTTGGMAASMITYGLYAQNTPNLRIDHNRYSNPNVLTGGGGAAAFAFFNSTGVRFVYNDVYSSELANTAAYLMNFDASGGAYLSGNIFVNYMGAASGNSVILNVVDAASQSGLYSDFNDLHVAGSNPRVGRWGTPTPHNFANWQSFSGKDANSLSADPLWKSTSTEDFHPLSAAVNGRYDPTLPGYVQDAASSPTIDRGDPAESAGAELFPGASRVNQGSYAQTVEASRAAPPAGCAVEETVGSGYHATIGDALSAVLSPLSANTCIVVRQTPNFESDIVVPAIGPSGFRLTIMGEPGVVTVLDSAGSTNAAFTVNSDSVTIRDLRIEPSGAHVNGIVSNGAYTLISSVTISAASNITGTAIRVTTGSIVEYSSVTSAGTAIELRGAGAAVRYSTAQSAGVGKFALYVNGGSSASVTGVHASRVGGSTVVFVGNGAFATTVAASTFTSGTGNALVIAGASRTMVTDTVMHSAASTALRFLTGAYDNVVALSTVTNFENTMPALSFDGASSNTVTGSYLYNLDGGRAALFNPGARYNTLSSMLITANVNGPLIEFVEASSNTLSQLFVDNTNGEGVLVRSSSHFNRLERSTVAAAGLSFYAMQVGASSGTVITESYISNRGSNLYGLHLANDAHLTSVDLSTVVSSPGTAFYVSASSHTRLTRSLVLGLGNQALRLADTYAARVIASTVATTGAAVALQISGSGAGGSDNVVHGSYAEGAIGILLTGAASLQRTSIESSRLASLSPTGAALQTQTPVTGLTVASSTFHASLGGYGMRLDGLAGNVIIATNTVPTGPHMSIYVSTAAPGTKVFITSNTILPPVDSGYDTCGICFDGLRTGATVLNNAVYYRTAGDMAPRVNVGIYAGTSHGLLIERNRISNPGMVTGGSYVGIRLDDAPRTLLRFNDVYSAVPALGAIDMAYGLYVTLSSSIHISNNVFSSSLTVTGSSASFRIDGFSTANSTSNFNIWHSSTGRNTMLDDTSAQEFPWGGGGGEVDRDSLDVTPHWRSVVAGAEDFHPLSHKGRYDPASQTFVADSWTAGSLDRGDYDVPVGDEPAGENGGRVNMGSYGGTAEASKTPDAPTAPQLFSVHATSIAVSFTGAGGAPGYTVAATSVPNFAVYVSSSGPAAALVLAPQGLLPNTTYTLVVGANWGDAFVGASTQLSTPTLALVPGLAAGVSFPLVHRTSATAAWSGGGNPVGVTTYTVTLTTSLAFPNADAGNVTVTTFTYSVAPSTWFFSLAPNTTYHAYAAAVNHARVPSDYLFLGSTATRANEPVAPTEPFAAVLDQSFSVGWLANGNPLVITSYTITVSTANDFNVWAASVTLTSAPASGPAASFTGLTPSTTYYVRVAARNGDGELTEYAVLGSTVMLPLQIQAPAVQPVTAAHVSSITVSWGLSASATGYTLVASLNPGNPPAAWASSTTFGQANTTATVYSPALDPNTTYYLFVQAHGFNGNSVFAAIPATTTLPAAPMPTPVTYSAVHTASATVNWFTGGNPVAVTTYTLVLTTGAAYVPGTAGDVLVTTLSLVGPAFAEVGGLTPNTTYTAFVAALGHAGSTSAYVSLGSTATRAALPVFAAESFVNVLDQSLSVTWGANGNPLSLTSYTVVLSTAFDFNTYASSMTLTTAPIAGPMAGFTGLIPSTTYHLKVAARNGDGALTDYLFLGTTVTLPLQIQAPATQPVTTITTHSITASWGLSANATGYTLYAYTDDPPTLLWASSTTIGQAYATATVQSPALEPNTTYFLFVQAHGFNGNSVIAAFPAVATLPAEPVTAVTTYTVVQTATITVNWLTGGNPLALTTYTLVMSTGPAYAPGSTGNVVVSTFPGVAAPFAEVFGLTPNTTYTAFVAALGHAGSTSAFVSLGSTATRAALPIRLAVSSSGVTDQSFTVDWGANGNPLGLTTYTVVASTASDFNAYATSFTNVVLPVAGPSTAFGSLVPGTTYYTQVAARNGDGAYTAFTDLGATVLLPLQLLAPAVQPVTSASTYSLTASWGLSVNATGYTLYASLFPDDPPTAVWASSQTFGLANTTATVFAPALQPNTTYFLFVRAHGFTSNSPYAAYLATATLPATPVTAASTYSAVAVTSFTVSWLADGNPLAMTTYTVVASTASDFNVGAASVTLSTVPAGGPSATFTGLAAYTTYFVQVRALGQGVWTTPFVALGSTQTLPIVLPAPVLGATSVSASSMSATWSLVAGATGYTLVAAPTAANPPVGVLASSVVAGGATLTASVFGLLPNATHYLFVRADGPGASGPYDVFAATATDPVYPLPAAVPFSGVTNGVVVTHWEQDANPVGVTTYTVTLSTTPTFPNVSAGNQSAPTVVPAAASASQGLAGLQPNTTYFAYVESRSHAGARFGAVVGATATLANAPLAPAQPILTVGITSVTVSWNLNSNPDVTTFTVVASTASDFNAFASSVVYSTAPGASGHAVLAGLSFGTTWHFQVRAVNHGGVPSSYEPLGSTYTRLSNLIPQILDFQGGDDVWRRVVGTKYDVQFADGSGLGLDRFAVSVSSFPGADPDAAGFTDVLVGLPPNSYSTPFALPSSVFDAMRESATNYVTVRVYNLVPATNTVVDAFYVRKDTTLPNIVNGEVGGDSTVQTAPGRLYAVTAHDTGSGLAQFQYSVSLAPGTGDGSVLGWTSIASPAGATEYITPWTIDFAALQTGNTHYVSVRAIDVAGSTTTLFDAFRVLKDTTGPAVAISTPSVVTGFVSVPNLAEGGATGAFGVKGVEVAVQEQGSGFYWNTGTSLFNSAAPVWMPATGSSSWTITLGVAFAEGTAYRVVARSSTTYSLYSAVYATAAFVVDRATPTVGVSAPAAVTASLTAISGTAADPGGAPSGVANVEVRLKRLSDGLYWNWVTDAWGTLAVSSFSGGGAAWNVTPSAMLQANMASGSSYYIAVRATDASLPANAGDFFAQGSTFTFNDPTPPAAIADLAAVNGPTPGSIALTWTAQGAHGGTGITALGQYAVFHSTNAADAPSTATAQVLFATASVVPGSFQGYIKTSLSVGVTYFIRVAMANMDGNWSAFSVQATTTATPAPSDSIMGHVVNASTQGITAVRVDAFDSTGLLVATAFTLADGSGTFTVAGLLPGTYKIEASWTANGITSSVWQDGIAMGSVGVDFSLDINYALATLTGTLGALTASGQAGLGVAGSGHRPSAEGSYVELYQGGREVAQVAAEPTGRWTIGNLLPGRYAVRAYTGTGYTEFVDVDLAEGEIRTVGFVVNALPEEAVFAFPNPARYSATIRFETALQPLEAQIAIFDLKGALVREVPGSSIVATATPGLYHYVWDLTNSRGQAVASGVYLFMVKVKGGSESQLVKVVKKLAVVR